MRTRPSRLKSVFQPDEWDADIATLGTGLDRVHAKTDEWVWPEL
ncbi:MAG: hypothetical protein AB7N65_21645 [Vicinamibacterales bacterium]